MNTTTYEINQLDCASCSMTIEEISERQPGVERAEVNSRKRQLTVSYSDGFASDKLVQVLTDAGYPIIPSDGETTIATTNRDHISADGLLDPVCKMTVTTDAQFQFSYEGTKYFFCSEACLKQFEENPKTFIIPNN